MNENYESNGRYSIKTEEDEEAGARALQISLLEEEKKEAEIKNLWNDLARELELTTQEYLQKSKESEERNMEIAIKHSLIINPIAYTPDWEKQINSDEELTTYANKVMENIKPQE